MTHLTELGVVALGGEGGGWRVEGGGRWFPSLLAHECCQMRCKGLCGDFLVSTLLPEERRGGVSVAITSWWGKGHSH